MTQAPGPSELPEDQYVAARREKLALLRQAGLDAFPPRTHRTHTCAQIHEQFETLARSEQTVAVAGRVTLLRIMGRASFVEIRDGTDRLQLFFAQDVLGAEPYALLKATLDLGDHIGAEGTVFLTRTGEQTVRATAWTMLSKALRPPPEKWHGLSDIEARLRRRYLDLIANPATREVLAKRSAIVREMRRFLDGRGFVEIETPVLQALHGGATARPFHTHHNALDRDLYLRISLELYLKRLLIGGYDKVYEIGRNFRNEGIDRRHNPEFTMLECYEAYADYQDVMRLTEEMVSTVAERVLGTRTFTVQGQEVDVTPPWPRIPHQQAILDKTGIDYRAHPTLPDLEQAIRDAGLTVEPQKTWAQLVDQLQSTFVEPSIVQPVFLVDYPVELSPLAKRKSGSADTVERFEAFAAGIEIGNAFTELNDPDDQYQRFLDQAKQAQAGDEEAHTMDLDFIEAMQHGMPPAGGLGIGIERLCMFLLDIPNIREVIAFPMLRQEE